MSRGCLPREDLRAVEPLPRRRSNASPPNRGATRAPTSHPRQGYLSICPLHERQIDRTPTGYFQRGRTVRFRYHRGNPSPSGGGGRPVALVRLHPPGGRDLRARGRQDEVRATHQHLSNSRVRPEIGNLRVWSGLTTRSTHIRPWTSLTSVRAPRRERETAGWYRSQQGLCPTSIPPQGAVGDGTYNREARCLGAPTARVRNPGRPRSLHSHSIAKTTVQGIRLCVCGGATSNPPRSLHSRACLRWRQSACTV